MNQIDAFSRVSAVTPLPVLLCFSHLRWDFVFQRPQHLMERAMATYRVFYIEEPVHADGRPHLRIRSEPSGVMVVTPVFHHTCDAAYEQKRLLADLLTALQPAKVVRWYYTPMAMRFSADLPADLTVYDCMDELSAFRFAPADLGMLEQQLMLQSNLVFTGGASLYAAKAGLHADVTCFPSSVDVAHFGQARLALPDPDDQAGIAKPRIGYFGVIDERMDLDLVALAAAQLPDVQFVMLGPVVKVDPASLPKAQNLHWLGRKEYAELPLYMANWQAAWMPFALNDATRYISPTKTPEFLAAGLQVTSTAVRDVIADWGAAGLVQIADAAGIAVALRRSLETALPSWNAAVDARLASLSWDRTWAAMAQRMIDQSALVVRS